MTMVSFYVSSIFSLLSRVKKTNSFKDAKSITCTINVVNNFITFCISEAIKGNQKTVEVNKKDYEKAVGS